MKGIYTILLLLLSNVFMTLAWYTSGDWGEQVLAPDRRDRLLVGYCFL